MKLIINGRLPSLNEYIDACRTNRYVGAKMKRDTEDMISRHIKQQLHSRLTVPVRLRIDWYEPNSRRDSDNVVFGKKFILDALVGEFILQNDDRKHVVGFEENVYTDRENPRIEVEIVEIE